MLRYTHVLFDLDGTIYDSTPANIRGLMDMLKKHRPDTQETYESLLRFAGTPAAWTVEQLGFPKDHNAALVSEWYHDVGAYAKDIRAFPGLLAAAKYLKSLGAHLGIVTSRDRCGEEVLGAFAVVFPLELQPIFDMAIGADDTERGKPAPDPLLKYLERSGAKASETLYIGDTATDLMAAQAAGMDFGLALWGYEGRRTLPGCTWQLSTPWDAVTAVTTRPDSTSQRFKWARELAGISQVGLHYCKDEFDRERFERVREIACEMLASGGGITFDEAKENYACERGYACPKSDTRAAVFDDQDRILLVQERSGLWDLPGGWFDDGQTVVSNALKELREEAGMEGRFVKLVAVLDRNRHNVPRRNWNAVKFFVECAPGQQDFRPNSETLACRYFAQNEIPWEALREDTTTREEIGLCFAAHADPHWVTVTE